MLSFLRKLFGQETARTKPVDDPAAWDDIDSWLFPPSDMHDPAAWDNYWYNQVSHGLGAPLFDMFVSDETLVEVMARHGFRTILCAGNGISQEPRTFAAAGFEVTALDSSPLALRIAKTWQSGESSGRTEVVSKTSEGRVHFVVGDLLDADVCPGPFDVVIERRTLQVFSEVERPSAVDALLARLQPEGILVSQCHDARWRPPAEPSHPVRTLLQAKGIHIWSGGPGPKPAGRVGWVETSTG
jgi:hypothetical protein